jgi:hypothetical protein
MTEHFDRRRRRKKERRESLAKRRVSFGQDTIKLIPHNDDLRTLSFRNRTSDKGCSFVCI